MSTSVDAVHILALDEIRPSASNPRRSFNDAADQELYLSIKAHGILTPLLVRPISPHDYEVVAGHRRYAAARELGLEALPVTVRELSDDQAREAAIIENLHREDLAPLDEAESYQALLSIPGASPASIAAAVGKSPAHIGRRLKLLTLIGDAQHALRDGRMDVARAELLTKLSPEVQAKALTQAVWMPLYAGGGQCAETLEPLSDLRAWVEKRTRLTVADLIADDETRALFPDAAEAVIRDPNDAECEPQLLEVALDRFGQSPAGADIPAGVLRLNKDFREVTGKRCKSAVRAVVVFGQRKGDVVLVCRDKKGCTTHWPPKVKADPEAGVKPRLSWEQEQAKRQREHAIFERVVPDLRKAVLLATAKVKTTPQSLTALLHSVHQREDVQAAIAAVGGKVTLENFVRVSAIVDAFNRLYNVHGAELAIKELKLAFDLKNAMKAAEAAMARETTVPKAEAKKATGKPAKKTRRVA
jgi:ParB/RepB/Spo0J family partition protein